MTLILSTERKQLDSILETNIAIVEDTNNDLLTRKSSINNLNNFLVEIERYSLYSENEYFAVWVIVQELFSKFSELN